MSYTNRGKYFQDLNVGDEFYTPSRTVTEADVVNFAYLSEDWNPLHTDEEFAKKTDFKARIAHGMVALAMMTGLIDRIGLWEGTAIAFIGLTWKFKAVVKFGDTITARIVVAEKKEAKKSDRGVVTYNISIDNQRKEVTSEGSMTMMIAAK